MSAVMLSILVILFAALLLRMRENRQPSYVNAPVDEPTSDLKYGGFWRRLGAILIDALVFIPVILAYNGIAHISCGWTLCGQIGMAIIGTAYTVGCHAKFGRTLGKLATGLRVVRPDGSAIGWKHAWLRSSVDIGFSVLAMVALAMALQAIPDEQFSGVGWQARWGNIEAHKQTQLAWVDGVQMVWFWSEVVVMLFNRKRRALHDYIAGTVVIVRR